MGKIQLSDEWEWNLSHHTPTPDGVAKILEFREHAKTFAEAILALAPTGRERDEALKHLEEALMYANQSIARSETFDNTDVAN